MRWPIYAAIFADKLLNSIENMVQKYDHRYLYRTYINYLEFYPVTTILSTVSFVTYAIPIVLFFGFGLITSVVTFSGFLFIEGTILGVAFVALLGVLTVISFFLGTLIFACWMFCYVFAQIFEITSMNVTVEPIVAPDRERTFAHIFNARLSFVLNYLRNFDLMSCTKLFIQRLILILRINEDFQKYGHDSAAIICCKTDCSYADSGTDWTLDEYNHLN